MNESDRELLELAAKAGGIDPSATGYTDFMEYANVYWNPLTNDGDAFRLATKLHMSVEISNYEESTYAYAGEVPRVYAMENWSGYTDAATRRAIVRAAAEVGREL